MNDLRVRLLWLAGPLVGLWAIGCPSSFAQDGTGREFAVYAVYGAQTDAQDTYERIVMEKQGETETSGSYAVVSKDEAGTFRVNAEKSGFESGDQVVEEILRTLAGSQGAFSTPEAVDARESLTRGTVGLAPSFVNSLRNVLTASRWAIIGVVPETRIDDVMDFFRRSGPENVLSSPLAPTVH